MRFILLKPQHTNTQSLVGSPVLKLLLAYMHPGEITESGSESIMYDS